MPPLPLGLTGNTFEAMFGSQQSMLELFILKRKIKGPCWLTVKNAQRVLQVNDRRSWCKHEIRVNNPKDIECTLDDLNKQSPPLIGLTLSIKTTRSQHNTTEIAMLSGLVQNKVQQDGPTNEERFQSFTMIRKLDQIPLPHDIHQKVKGKSTTVYSTEKQMLDSFVSKMHTMDPDLLVGHNLQGSMIEILLARIQMLRVPHWSRLGRFKRGSLPTRKNDG